MSGGSFDYVCFKLDSNGTEVISTLPTLADMERRLRAYGKHEAADELLRNMLKIESMKHRLNVIGKHLYNLAHDLEWWQSGDIDSAEFDARFKEAYLEGD